MEAEGRRVYRVTKQIDHSMFNLQLRSDGIVQVNIFDDSYLTIKETKEYVNLIDQLTRGIPHLVLKIAGEHSSLDSEARAYMATTEAQKCSIADAVIVRSMAQRIIGNFYIKFDKPVKPVKLFDTVEDAELWLNTFR